MRAIIVDDEEDSIEILQTMLGEHCKEMEIVNSASNALEAITKITTDKPDIVFLDVQMPGYDGFDVLKNISTTPAIVIFTTAHKEYAIEALRKGAFDYLLKPIDIAELKRCVERIKDKLKSSRATSKHIGFIEVAVKEGTIFIKPADLIRLEADGSYTRFYLEKNIRHIASKGIKEYELQLDHKVFYRCHKSHIINLKKVTKFHLGSYQVEMSDGSLIEISKKNKDDFMQHLRRIDV